MDIPELMGWLYASVLRGKETFHFEYSKRWLAKGFSFILDPNLNYYEGPQYPSDEIQNFGLFLDSSHDRWGSLLMQRREAVMARI